MSDCPGLHCPGCGDISLSAILKLAAAVVAIVLAVVFGVAIVITLAVAAAVAVVLAVFLAVRAWRHGWRPSFRTVIAWEPYTPVESRAAEALPAPQFHLHLHGPLTREQLAEVAAVRQAGYRAFDQRERS